jgi:hypothetical protein
MSGYGKPANLGSGALKKTEISYNVMLPGSGTPWEDRGAAGFISAYFKTTLQSLFSFRRLVDQIRRPETTGDATSYAVVCGVMWALGIGIWDIIQYVQAKHDTTHHVIEQQYLIESVIRAVGALVLTVVIYKLATTLFYSLLTHDSQRQIPKVMISNVFAYALGPSILALIPVVGWGLAVLWIIINAIVGARTRLYLKMREALVNVIIAAVVGSVLLAAIYFAAYFIWPVINGSHSVEPNEVRPKSVMNR